MAENRSARTAVVASVLILLAACHHATPPAASGPPCPGEYTIAPGSCQHDAPTGCQGVCGYILRQNGCAPVKGASIAPYVVNVVVPNASSDENGRFDLVGVAPGHYTLRVMAEQDDARIELDVVGGAQPLAAPLELVFASRSCACGGACTN